MTLRTLKNVKDKVLVVGSIYDNLDKIEKIAESLDDYSSVIFNGNLLYPFDNVSSIRSRIHLMNELLETQKVIYNVGNYDLKLFSILQESLDCNDIQQWIITKPNVVAIDFENTSSVLVVSGGLTPNINTRNSLIDNLEVSFVSLISDKPWQVYYGGWLGYVISNNPMSSDKPKFFPYSAQIGIKHSKDSDVYAQEVAQSGLKNIIRL